MEHEEFFAPWRVVAAYGDGSRLTFDGFTEEQAKDAMEAAQDEHGDITWRDHVTIRITRTAGITRPSRNRPASTWWTSPAMMARWTKTASRSACRTKLPGMRWSRARTRTSRRSSSSATLRLIQSIRTKSNHGKRKARRVDDLTGLWC